MVFSLILRMGDLLIFDIFSRSKIISLLLSVAICLAYISFIPVSYQDSGSPNANFTDQNKVFCFDADIGHGKHFTIELPLQKLIFKPVVNVNKAEGITKSISINFV